MAVITASTGATIVRRAIGDSGMSALPGITNMFGQPLSLLSG
jgi:hypothetical protein